MWLHLALLALQAQDSWQHVTYVGGQGSEYISAVASDASGNTILAGWTTSLGAPFSEEPTGVYGTNRAFVLKMDAAGRKVYGRDLGVGFARALAIDAGGNALVAGSILAQSPFTPTPGAYQTTVTGGAGAGFIAKLSPVGEILFATYFGDRNSPSISSVTLDADGNPVFCGQANESDVPLTPQTLFPARSGFRLSGFCAKLSSDGSKLLFSTLLGASGLAFGGGCAVDSNSHLWVAGSTLAAEFPLVNAVQTEDRRRSLFRPFGEAAWQSVGGPEPGTVVSLQVIGTNVFAGTRDAAWMSPDRGETWRRLPGLPGGVLAAHPRNLNHLCVADFQVACSTDGGVSSRPILFSSNATYVQPDPAAEGGFFVDSSAPFSGGNYVSLAGAAPRLNLPERARSISVDASGQRLLAAMWASLVGRLYLSTDRGATFRVIAERMARAVFAPSNPDVIYAVRSQLLTDQDSLVIRSEDGGNTWTDTGSDAPFQRVTQITVDPADPRTLYVVDGAGAYRSSDAGERWELWMPSGLENTSVNALAFDAEGKLWAGTNGSANGFLMKIDMNAPAIVSSTILGGTGGGGINALEVDATGRVIVTGNSLGEDLPATGPELSPRINLNANGFLAEFSAMGQLESLRYAGVPISAMDRDAAGRLHLGVTAGRILSVTVPVANNVFAGGSTDAAWLTLSPDLSQLTNLTWLGGSAADSVTALHAGADGRLRLAGITRSENFPTKPSALQTKYGGGADDSFVAIPMQSSQSDVRTASR